MDRLAQRRRLKESRRMRSVKVFMDLDDASLAAIVDTMTPKAFSPGHVIVNVESEGERGAFVGDLMHHPIQVPHPEWSTCFCWDLEISAASRTAFVDTHTDAGTLVLPVHFAGATAGHITRDGDAQKFTFLDDPS